MNQLFTVLTVLIVGIAASAQRETYLRLPVLVLDTNSEKVTPAAKMKVLNLPNTVVISGKTNPSLLMTQLGKKINDNRYEISAYGTISHHLENLDENLKLCYGGDGKQAVELITNLADSFLSDQVELYFYRTYSDTHFRRTQSSSRQDDLVKVGDEDYEHSKQYLKRRLKPGQIQTLTAYSDGGDDTSEDVIEHCK